VLKIDSPNKERWFSPQNQERFRNDRKMSGFMLGVSLVVTTLGKNALGVTVLGKTALDVTGRKERPRKDRKNWNR